MRSIVTTVVGFKSYTFISAASASFGCEDLWFSEFSYIRSVRCWVFGTWDRLDSCTFGMQ